MITTTPVVHDLQFGTYSSPHTARGRHGSWPAMGGLTRSHGRRAGAWVRVGDRSWWCCLQRPHRPVAKGVLPPALTLRRRLPVEVPPVRTEPVPALRRAAEFGLHLSIAGLILVAVIVLALLSVGMLR